MESEWTDPNHVRKYLGQADHIPHRTEGETVLLDLVSPDTERILDLGTGDGRLLALVLARCPSASGVGLDVSPPILGEARKRFAGQTHVELVSHDLDRPLPHLGSFDLVVSSFAIHHCSHRRKQALYAEIVTLLEPGGLFCNLEHVSSPTPALHARFLAALGATADDDDPSNRLLDVETQVRWLRDNGFVDVDCYWKWLELALFGGWKPGRVTGPHRCR
jgi:tRNA (cmo5U34)-methyltransferase